MFDDQFRAILPKYVKPLIGLLIKMKVTPNQVSFFAFLLAGIASYLLANGKIWWSLALWWLSRLADGIDGILARESNQKTSFGGYLDILLDMGAYSLMIVGFSFLHKEHFWLWNGLLVAYVLCITSVLALSSIIEGIKNDDKLRETFLKYFMSDLNASNRTLKFTTGLAEAGETSLAYTLFIIFPTHIQILGLIWLIIVLFTVIQRSILASQLLKHL